MRIASAMALLTVIAITALGCDEKVSDITGPTPNLQISFASIQREIFNTTDASGRQACIGCHNAQQAPFVGNLNLADGSAYASLVGVASSGKRGAVRVIAGDPNGSYLVHKLEGGPDIVGNRMPNTGGPYLTPGQMAVIRRWIQEGAKND
jgi:hypothetical protein